MRVSICIATWNRCDLLRATLDGMTRMAIPRKVVWEVVVVNNGCTDATDEVARAFQQKLPLRLLSEPWLGVSHARNCALDNISGEYVLWTDDDVLVDADWLVNFVEATRRHPSAAAFGGVIAPWFVADPDPLLCEAFPVLGRGFCGVDHGPLERPLPRGTDLIGANLGYRRSAIQGLRFDPQLGPRGTNPVGGEENAFQERVRARGGVVMWCPAMRVRHYVDPARMTLPYLLKFYSNVGLHEVRIHGTPPGAQVFGVPRWLVRRYLDAYARQVVARVAGVQRRRLHHLREQKLFEGMIRESWASRRRFDARPAGQEPSRSATCA